MQESEVMLKSWFVKYKPTNTSEYIFHDIVLENNINEFIKNEFIPGNLLLYGSPGNGKSCLVELLVNKIAKDGNNFKRITSRSVDEIDELGLFLKQQPYDSKQKIILIEEIDRLSRQAIIQLKDGLLEYFSEENCFIATTNNINRIDKGLRSRFLNFNIELVDIESTMTRLRNILSLEKVEYNNEELFNFVENNKDIGFRGLLTELQINTNNKILKLNDINLSTLLETELVDLIYKVLAYTIKEKDVLILADIRNGKTKHFKEFFPRILEIINSNTTINYETVILKILDRMKNINMGLYVIGSKFVEDINTKTFKHLAILHFISDCVQLILDLNNAKTIQNT
jgi:replication-associated recombination protein RarA